MNKFERLRQIYAELSQKYEKTQRREETRVVHEDEKYRIVSKNDVYIIEVRRPSKHYSFKVEKEKVRKLISHLRAKGVVFFVEFRNSCWDLGINLHQTYLLDLLRVIPLLTHDVKLEKVRNKLRLVVERSSNGEQFVYSYVRSALRVERDLLKDIQ